MLGVISVSPSITFLLYTSTKIFRFPLYIKDCGANHKRCLSGRRSSIKVRNAGDAVYDLVLSAIEKAKIISAKKVKELATRDISPAVIATKKDARDIAARGESVESQARTFESLMTEMRKQPYSEQVPLLRGYKKLLEIARGAN